MAETIDPKVLEILIKRINDNVKKEGECLISQHRTPYVRHKSKEYNIAKTVAQYYKKTTIAKSYMSRPTCNNSRCIEPLHLKFVSQGNPSTKEEIIALMQSRSTTSSDNSGCKILSCNKNHQGYGRWEIDGKRYSLGRVIIWVYGHWDKITDLAAELDAAHMCRTLTCITPNHYELVTRSINMQHKIRDGTSTRGEAHPNAKLSEDTVIKIMDTWKPKDHVDYKSPKQRAEIFQVDRQIIYSIDDRTNWNHLEHPNGIQPKTRKPPKKLTSQIRLSNEKLLKRLKTLSRPNTEINQFTGTPCVGLGNQQLKKDHELFYKERIFPQQSLHVIFRPARSLSTKQKLDTFVEPRHVLILVTSAGELQKRMLPTSAHTEPAANVSQFRMLDIFVVQKLRELNSQKSTVCLAIT